MTRIEVAVTCDLSEMMLREAVRQVVGEDGQALKALIVHPYAKHLAERLLFRVGLRVPLAVNIAFDEDEWILRGETREVHSPGA